MSRKPHAGNAGFVCELKCKLGGHVVVYDRDKDTGIDASDRWVVMHEPSSLHVAVHTQAQARAVMKGVAKARTIEEANRHAQILPQPAANPSVACDDDGAELTVAKQRRLAAADARRAAALERFLADPENEPSEEGKAALRVAFELDERGRK